MLRIDKGAPPPRSLRKGWKIVGQSFPRLQRLLYGKHAYQELASRTRGSRCVPDSRNPKGIMKSQEAMKEECAYWMRFITSNSKVRIGKDGQGTHLPFVIFVLTKKDTLQGLQLGYSQADANTVVRELRSEFKAVVNLCEDIQFINARSAGDVSKLLTLVRRSLGSILKIQTEYAICQDIREILGRWSAGKGLKPVLKLEEYYQLCQREMKSPNPLISLGQDQRGARSGRDVVLAYLNDVGEIISLKGLDFIVTDPRWFGVGVLGSLINAFKGEEGRTGLLKCWRPTLQRRWDPPKDGFLDREHVKVLLEHSLDTMNSEKPLSPDQLTDLMIELEMCYKKDPDNAESLLFMPALFDDPTDSAAEGQRQLEWKVNETGMYLGRRLACKDKLKTFLSPGFFPRWQVHMLNWLQQKRWTSNRAFKIERNMIGFSHNGIEVLIEYSGDRYCFIDILVKSSKPFAEALEFIETNVLRNIRDFCASPQGCQGVELETSVIRPSCVRKPDKCIDRKDQVVLVSFLEENLAMDPSFKHTWEVAHGQESDTSYAMDLLNGKDSFSSKQKTLADRMPNVPSCSASSSSHGDDLPKLIYPTIHDVGMLRNCITSLNLRKKIALKLHLLCDHKDGSHEVERQPGRTYILNWTDGGIDVPIAKLLVTLACSAAGVGLTVAGAPFALPSIDGLLRLFEVPIMPIIELETLRERMNPAAQALGPVSNEEICGVLTRYMETDPGALGLRKFLNLGDSTNFWTDFQLRKVVYTEAAHQGRIGWVCDRCYWEGYNDEILKTVELT